MQVTKQFVANCAECGVILNNFQEKPTNQYDFLGVQFNHQRSGTWVRARPLTVEKLQQKIFLNISHPTLRQCLGTFGQLVWLSLIQRIPLSEFSICYKFLRRRVGWNLDAKCNVWRCSIGEWEKWHARAAGNTWRKVSESNVIATHLFSDASLSGFGAVAFRSDESVAVTAGMWSDEEKTKHINILETLAVVRAVNTLDMDTNIHLHIDNTTALFSIRRGRSNNFHTNNCIKFLQHCGNILLSVEYVKSAENPADPFSRIDFN